LRGGGTLSAVLIPCRCLVTLSSEKSLMGSLSLRLAIAFSLTMLLGCAAAALAAQQTPAPVPRQAPAKPSESAEVAALRKRAEQGDALAQYDLGDAYDKGQGVSQDYVEAYKWRKLAVVRTSPDKKKQYAESRDELEQRMTPQQLAEAQRRASEWLAAFEKREK
jgi:TPR repeat protein